MPDATSFLVPQNTAFFAKVFRMDPVRVAKLLARCPVADWGRYNNKKTPMWDFIEATPYLIDPKIDIETWLLANKNNLPTSVSKGFWDAQLARQRWEVRARHLWHDDDVIEVFGNVAMTIKESMQLWVENLPGKSQMTTAQYEALMTSVSQLQDDIHNKLVAIPKARRTLSSLHLVEGDETPDAVDGDED